MAENTAFNASLSGWLNPAAPSSPNEIIFSPSCTICSASSTFFGIFREFGEGRPPPPEVPFAALDPPSLLLSLLLSLVLSLRSLPLFSLLISSLRVSLNWFLL